MATRNLTKRFLQLRERLRGDRSGLGGTGDYGVDGRQQLLDEDVSGCGNPLHSGLPPVWVDLVEAIKEDMTEIRRGLNGLGRLHTSRLKVSFDDDDEEQDREIELLTQKITSVFRKCENRLKRIATIGNNDGSLPYQERMIRLNVMRSQATSMQALSKEFRHMQKSFLLRLKGRDETAREFFAEEDMGTDASLEAALDQGFTEEQLQHLEEAKRSSDEREREIARIAQSINELASLFRELSVLVVEQGSLLDRIDYNIELTVEKVKAGTQEMKKAEDYQKRNKSNWCILILLIAIIICILILVYR